MSKDKFVSCKEYTGTILPKIIELLKKAKINHEVNNNEIIVNGKKKSELQKMVDELDIPKSAVLILIEIVEVGTGDNLTTYIRQKTK